MWLRVSGRRAPRVNQLGVLGFDHDPLRGVEPTAGGITGGGGSSCVAERPSAGCGDASRPSEHAGAHRHDLDRPSLEPALDSTTNAALDPTPRERKEQGEARKIREDPWGQQEGSADKNGYPVEKRLTREFARRDLGLELVQDPQPLRPGEHRARDSRKHHQSQSRPKPDHLPELDEQDQLDQWDDDEEEGQSA